MFNQTFRIHFTIFGSFSINKCFMPCEPIKPAAEKQHISSEGDQNSLQEKTSKTDIEDMPFNVTCKMVQNLWCDPCPSDEF